MKNLSIKLGILIGLRFIVLCMLSFSLFGCESTTKYGKCIGIQEEKDPNLKYKISKMNVVIGTVLFPTILPPVTVLGGNFYCPVGVVK